MHQPFMGWRATDAAFYPKKLLGAIIRGMARTRDSINAVRELEKDGWDVTMNISIAISLPYMTQHTHIFECRLGAARRA